MTDEVIEQKYSKLIGLQKTLKNFTILVLIPFFTYVIANQVAFLDFVPDKYKQLIALALGCIGYYIKNYQENKDNGNIII